jgi:hypothetical protein
LGDVRKNLNDNFVTSSLRRKPGSFLAVEQCQELCRYLKERFNPGKYNVVEKAYMPDLIKVGTKSCTEYA